MQRPRRVHDIVELLVRGNDEIVPVFREQRDDAFGHPGIVLLGEVVDGSAPVNIDAKHTGVIEGITERRDARSGAAAATGSRSSGA